MLEDLANTFVCLGRAFQILVGINLLADFITLCAESGMSAFDLNKCQG
jgi:hypothetical protein